MKNEKKFNTALNLFILVGMLVAVVVTNVFKIQQPGARHFMLLLASVGALTGVINTVLSANGNIWTFLFGVIDVSVATVVAFDSSIRPAGLGQFRAARVLFPAYAVRRLVAVAQARSGFP